MSLVEDTKEKIILAGNEASIDKSLIKDFLEFDNKLKVNIKQDGNVYFAIRSQHNNWRGPYKGGLRFSPQVNEDEVSALSMWMSLKTSLIGIPFGGGKGGITIDPREVSQTDQKEILTKFITQIADHIGPDKDILAPDVNTDGTTMEWLVEAYRQARPREENPQAVTTGKPVDKGGIKGRTEATSWGAYFALRSYLENISQDIGKITVSIQGFGNAAIYYAQEISKAGGKVVAVSDSSGGIHNKEGLDIDKLIKIKEETGKVTNYQSAEKISNDELLALEVDYLSLAALEDAITNRNANKIGARNIVEIANGGVNPNAEKTLKKKDILVLPDILVNAGGVYVSYLEWLQNTTKETFDKAKVRKMLEEKMSKSSEKLWQLLEKYPGLSTKTVAYILALKNLEEVYKK